MGVDDDLGARNDDDGDAEGAEGADASPTSPRSAAIPRAAALRGTQSEAARRRPSGSSPGVGGSFTTGCSACALLPRR